MDMCYDGALVMPSSYAAMSEDEMTYVEGGWSKVKKWYGIGVKLNGNETSQFLSDASWLAVIICGIAGCTNKVAGIVAAVTCGAYGFKISRMNKDKSGVTMIWTWGTFLNPGKGVMPTIIDNKKGK